MQGLGTIDNPYVITQISDFEPLRSNLNAFYHLGNDIDFKGASFVSIGDSNARFEGNFDGKGYAIKNVKVVSGTGSLQHGFFGYTSNAVVKNIKFENITSDFVGKGTSATTTSGLLSSVAIGDFNNIHITGTFNLSGVLGRIGGVFGTSYETVNRLQAHNIYTEITMNVTNATPQSATIRNIGGVFGIVVNDNANISPNVSNIVANNKLNLLNTNSNNFTIGRIVGSRNYESTYQNVYANISHFNNNYIENFTIVTDGTILNPLVLDNKYWIHEEGQLPKLAFYKDAKIKQFTVLATVKSIASEVELFKKKYRRVNSYCDRIITMAKAIPKEALKGSFKVDSYIGTIHTDNRIRIKAQRTSYILNVNSDIATEKKKQIKVSTHTKPITTSAKNLSKLYAQPSTYIKSINTNVSKKLSIKVSSTIQGIISDRHVKLKSEVNSYIKRSEVNVQTKRNRIEKVVGHVSSLKSSLAYTKKKQIQPISIVPSIKTTHYKTQVKQQELSSCLTEINARVIKGGYIRFSSHIQRKQILGKSTRSIKTKRLTVSTNNAIVGKTYKQHMLHKKVVSNSRSIISNSHGRSKFFLPKMITAKGKVTLNKSVATIKKSKTRTRYTGNSNSSYPYDKGGGN